MSVIRLERLGEALRRAPGLVEARILNLFERVSIEAEAAAKSDPKPRSRTGDLRRSITGSSTLSGSTISLSLQASGDYARTQEGPPDGSAYTVVRAVRARYLSIPVGEALTGAGVPRYDSPRDVAGLYYVPRKGRAGGVLVLQEGDRRSPDDPVLFVLVPEVRIPATRFLSRAFGSATERMDRRIVDTATAAIEEAVRG